MYILLFIVILLVILFIMRSSNINVKMESFKNIGKNVFSQVRKVDFNTLNNKHITHENEVNTCKNTTYRFKNYDFAYRSKYDATTCIKCKNPPKCSEHNYKCIDEKSGYNIQDNCTEDGVCRINEDVINMFPVKTCIDKNKN
jgi:hypothetical protein